MINFTLEEIQKNILCIYNAWDLHSILKTMIQSSEILLHKEDYDGHGWEGNRQAMLEAKKIVEFIESKYSKDE